MQQTPRPTFVVRKREPEVVIDDGDRGVEWAILGQGMLRPALANEVGDKRYGRKTTEQDKP